MKVLEQAAKDGLAASADGKLTLQTEVGKLITATEKIGKISKKQQKKLSKMLKPTVSSIWEDEVGQRFISKPQLGDDVFKNKVVAFLLVNAKNALKQLSQFKVDSKTGGFSESKTKINYNTAFAKMGDDFYIDIKRMAIIPTIMAIQTARLTGDLLNGFKVPKMPAHSSESDVIPLGIIMPVKSSGERQRDKQFTGFDIRRIKSGVLDVNTKLIS